VTFDEATELFCLDLYKEFDLDRLATIAGPEVMPPGWQITPDKTRISSVLDFLTRCRLVGTDSHVFSLPTTSFSAIYRQTLYYLT